MRPKQRPYPELLPGGRAVLFTVVATRAIQRGAYASTEGARIEVLDLETGARKTIVRGGSRARYLPTGHLVYTAAGSLYAASFDADGLRLRGEPVQVASDITKFRICRGQRWHARLAFPPLRPPRSSSS